MVKRLAKELEEAMAEAENAVQRLRECESEKPRDVDDSIRRAQRRNIETR